MQQFEGEKLRLYVQKIENLMDEKTEIQENISDVFKQAKADGFDTKIMKKVIHLKQMKSEDRENEDMLLCTYMHALGIDVSDDDNDKTDIK